MRVRARSALLLVMVIVAVAGGVAYVRSCSAGVAEARPAAEAAVPVTAAKVVRKNVPNVIQALGTVTPIETIAVQSRVNGQIMRAFFQQGQLVKQGDPLFLIDPRPYQAALDQAQAQLAHDQAVLKEAQTDLARYQKLEAENSIAAQKAADQGFTVEQDQGTVKVDQANVETAKLNLEYARVNSPATGMAGVMTGRSGQLCPGRRRHDARNHHPDRADLCDLPHPAERARRGSRSPEPRRPSMCAPCRRMERAWVRKAHLHRQPGRGGDRHRALYATFPNDNEALWPGEFVTVHLIVCMRKDAVTAPVGSVMSGPDGDYVYTIAADNVVHRVPVLVAARQNGLAVFTKGVSPGEQRRRRRPVQSRQRREGRDRTAQGDRERRAMNISEIFIRRPIATALMTAGLFVFGAVCFTTPAGRRAAERRFPDDRGVRRSSRAQAPP